LTHILAGLWGLKKTGISIRELYNAWVPEHAGSGSVHDVLGFGIDQNFLKLVVYPRFINNMCICYSNKRLLVDEKGIEFPFEWNEKTYCGRQEIDFIDVGEPRIRTAGEFSVPRPSPNANPLHFLRKK
jgi:hypothetical protein